MAQDLLIYCDRAKFGLERFFVFVVGGDVVKLSARNQFKGKIVAVEKGVITAEVKIEIKMPVTITAVITKEAVEELNLKVGDEVTAIMKSTEVMIAK